MCVIKYGIMFRRSRLARLALNLQCALGQGHPFRKAVLIEPKSGDQVLLSADCILKSLDTVGYRSPQYIPFLGKDIPFVPVEGLQSAEAVFAFDTRADQWTISADSGGVFVNDWPVPHLIRERLSDGDIVELGARIFHFSTVVGVKKSTSLHLLLIGSLGNAYELSRRQTNISTMLDIFRDAGRRPESVTTLFDAGSTKEAVLRELKVYKELLDEDSLFVFYFTGHGTRDGIRLYDSILSQRELYPMLSRIPGRKLIFLDSCHGSAFSLTYPHGHYLFSVKIKKVILILDQ